MISNVVIRVMLQEGCTSYDESLTGFDRFVLSPIPSIGHSYKYMFAVNLTSTVNMKPDLDII